MKKRGFTIVELLGVIVILSIIAAIATPIVQKTLNNNRDKLYDIIKTQLKDYTKDYLAVNTDRLPVDDGDTADITLEALKKNGNLQINVINPRTNNVISNQSYVKVTKKNNNYTYEVYLYDLVDADEVEAGAPTISLSSYSQSCSLNDTCVLEDTATGVSRQIIYKNEEVSSIDTSKAGIYSVYYSKLENNKLGIGIKTVTVG